jgi:hypothetical protein
MYQCDICGPIRDIFEARRGEIDDVNVTARFGPTGAFCFCFFQWQAVWVFRLRQL